MFEEPSSSAFRLLLRAFPAIADKSPARVTREEYGRLEKAAKRNGLPTSEFVRNEALKGAKS